MPVAWEVACSPSRAANRIATGSAASAPGDEREGRLRLGIEPLRVVDQDDERPRVRGGGEEAPSVAPPTVRRSGGRALAAPRIVSIASAWAGVSARATEEGRITSASPANAISPFDLDPARLDDHGLVGAGAGMFEQRRLADPRLAPHNQGAAVPADRRRDNRRDHRLLACPADRHGANRLGFPGRERPRPCTTVNACSRSRTRNT